MVQNKGKSKVKLPNILKSKKNKKNSGVSKRKNAPIASRKAKKSQAQKLKKAISKAVNASAENELRAIALDGQKSLISKSENFQNSINNIKKLKKK